MSLLECSNTKNVMVHINLTCVGEHMHMKPTDIANKRSREDARRTLCTQETYNS